MAAFCAGVGYLLAVPSTGGARHSYDRLTARAYHHDFLQSAVYSSQLSGTAGPVTATQSQAQGF